MAKRTWFVGVIAASLAVLLALSGCKAAGEPASTESLLVRYAAHEDSDNCHVKADIGLTLSLVGYRVYIPVTADLDVVGTALHGTVHADLSKLGVDDYEAEVYGRETDDQIEVYVGAKVKDSVVWTDFDLRALSSVDALAATNLLVSAEFNRVALESDEAICYELDIPTTTLLETVLSIVDKADLPDEFDEDALRAAIEGDKVKSFFTEDCLICSASTVAMGTYKGELSSGIPVSIKVDVKAALDGYGEVDPATLTVPEEVWSASTHTNLHEKDPVNVLAVVGEDNPLAERVKGSVA